MILAVPIEPPAASTASTGDVRRQHRLPARPATATGPAE
jgi:hypothetical protein